MLTFRTSDGYTLYLIGGEWVDNKDPDLVDMTFSDNDGWPVEAGTEEPLDGRLIVDE